MPGIAQFLGHSPLVGQKQSPGQPVSSPLVSPTEALGHWRPTSLTARRQDVIGIASMLDSLDFLPRLPRVRTIKVDVGRESMAEFETFCQALVLWVRAMGVDAADAHGPGRTCAAWRRLPQDTAITPDVPVTEELEVSVAVMV